MSNIKLKHPEYDSGELNGSSSSFSQRPPLRLASAGPQDQSPNQKQQIRIQKEQQKQQQQQKLQLASGNAEDISSKGQTEAMMESEHSASGETTRNSYTRRARHQADEEKKKRHSAASAPGAFYEPTLGSDHEQVPVASSPDFAAKKKRHTVALAPGAVHEQVPLTSSPYTSKKTSGGDKKRASFDGKQDNKDPDFEKSEKERRSSSRRSRKKNEKRLSQTSGGDEEASDSSDDNYETKRPSASSKKRDDREDVEYSDEDDRVGAINVRGFRHIGDDSDDDNIAFADAEQPSTGSGITSAAVGISSSSTNVGSNNDGNANDDRTVLIEAELVEEGDNKKKEREIARLRNVEARVQKEMRERENDIRNTLIVDVPQALPVSGDDENDGTEGGKKRTFVIIGAMVTLVAIVIGVVVAVTSGGATGSPLTPVTQRPSDDLLLMLLDLYGEENAHLDDVNLDLILNEDGTAFQTTSPQYMAYQWLIEVVEQAQQAETTIFDGNDAQGILELFSLLVLYYSTNGETWTYQNGFLNETVPSCQWREERIASMGGVSCDSSGRIIAIELGKNESNHKHFFVASKLYLRLCGEISLSTREA